MKKKESVILPGSYDPVTLGHYEIIKRAAGEYEQVYAVVFNNPEKCYKFSPNERVKMLILATEELDNVTVGYSAGLVIDYMREHGIEKIIKGYRNGDDLDYEMKQADWNFRHGGYPTEFIKCRNELKDVSSSEVRRRLDKGESIDELVLPPVIEYIKNIK